MAASETLTAELERLERERCRAISEHDWVALEGLLVDSYTHTHSTGVVQDKLTYMSHVKERPRAMTRGVLQIRPFGTTAIMTGRQTNTPEAVGSGPVESIVMQVWVQDGSVWKLAASQTTRIRSAG